MRDYGKCVLNGYKAALLATVSVCAMLSNGVSAQTSTPVEEVVVTGSLIRGASALGVPLTSLGVADFQNTGAITVADMLKSVPALGITPSLSPAGVIGGNATRSSQINLHGLNTLIGVARTLVLVDGLRYPFGGSTGINSDVSFLPQLAIDRVDVVATGASATYGSDAMAGVVNVVLKRNFDGAITQLTAGTPEGGGFHWAASQLYGRSWETGNITLAFTHYDVEALPGSARPNLFTHDFRPWGLDNRIPVRSSIPGVVSTGAISPSSAAIGTGCTNCFSIPKGQNGRSLTWGDLLANAGVNNLVEPYSIADVIPAQQSNSISATFYQDLWPGIHLFGQAYYSNRRGHEILNAGVSPALNNTIFTLNIPTTNPFYPVGAPAGLRVNYSFGIELPPTSSFFENMGRYAFGLDFELPFEWHGMIRASQSSMRSGYTQENLPNPNNLSAALGNTVPARPAFGDTPAIAAFTKPDAIPYLNVFCDPSAFQCNEQSTLDYINSGRLQRTHNIVNQFDAIIDGTAFTLPAGDVKLALGASIIRQNVNQSSMNRFGAPADDLPTFETELSTKRIYAFFGEIQIPIFGEANAIPFFQKLDIQLSERYDNYDEFGTTTNPRVAINWMPIQDLTLRGAWGTSFRAPAFTDVVAANHIDPINTAAGASGNLFPTCPTVGGTPIPGSFGAILNPTCSASLMFPAGMSVEGGASQGIMALLPVPHTLSPERSEDYSLGFEYAPTDNFLSGLRLSATYWNVDIRNVLAIFDSRNVSLLDPNTAFVFTPSTAPGFSDAVSNLLSLSVARGFTPGVASSIQFIITGLPRNAGSLQSDGIDFSADYVWQGGDIGDWNIGVAGVYYLHRKEASLPTATPIDIFEVPNQLAFIDGAVTTVNGQTQDVRLRYRGYIGWNIDNFSITAFVNYRSHFFPVGATLPPTATLLASGITNFSHFIPSHYTFDLAMSYNLADRPANDYLKNIRLSLAVNNILDRQPPFSYQTQRGPGTTAFYGRVDSPVGRDFAVTVTKTW